jgi:hemoglobin/transferrin/lactoferrin receptor protein
MSWNILSGRTAAVAALVPCSLTLLFVGFPAQAEQGQDSFGYSMLEGVTVTATKTARDPFEVAESVSIVDQDRIEAAQASDLADLLEDLPNVDVAGGPRSIGQRVVIRGLSDDRILFVIDGARQNYNRAHDSRIFLDPDLFKQVEVLRGPASALWGSGALGGVGLVHHQGRR